MSQADLQILIESLGACGFSFFLSPPSPGRAERLLGEFHGHTEGICVPSAFWQSACATQGLCAMARRSPPGAMHKYWQLPSRCAGTPTTPPAGLVLPATQTCWEQAERRVSEDLRFPCYQQQGRHLFPSCSPVVAGGR